MEFSRQGYWSGLPFPSPGDLPDPGIEPRSPALQAGSVPAEPPPKGVRARIQSIRDKHHRSEHHETTGHEGRGAAKRTAAALRHVAELSTFRAPAAEAENLKVPVRSSRLGSTARNPLL